jgi:hypothetical protein
VSIDWMRKAYELNTYDLSMAAAYGYSLIFCGEYLEGSRILQRAVDASSARPSWWDYSLFLAQFMLGDMEKASRASRALASTKRPHYLAARLVSAQARGQTREAAELAAELRAEYPAFSADPRAVFRASHYPTDLIDRFVDALRQAGLAEAS